MPALRASREGEEAPASSFINRQLQRWFKQLRRIQSLKHNIHAAGQHAAAIEYRLYLWQAIKAAKGFDGPFDYWWLQRPHQRQSAPGYLPEDIPAATVIEEIFEDFRTNYRNLEAWHLRQRQRALRVEYREQAKKAFQAVKGKEFHSMDHLVSYHYADILHVDAQTSEVLVDHALPEATNGLWFVDDEPAQTRKTGPNAYQVHTDLLLCPGQVLEHRVFYTNSTEILEELQKFWQPRWLRHRDVPAGHWDRILGFVQAHVPQLEMQVPAITVSAWDKVNARYNEHAASPPDGFDKQDLLRMPIVLKERMVQLLNHVEDTAQWPQQLLQGFGIPVPKETAADTINKFRPIIVLSTVYRSWSSLRAKVLIHFLEKFVGPNALGLDEKPARSGSTYRPQWNLHSKVAKASSASLRT